MERTPDEIKKGLNDPIPVHFHIGDPEPRLTPLALRDLEVLHTNALALIQQLQAQNAEQTERIRQLEDHLREATKKVEQLQAERDAAVKSLRGRCFECKHNKTSVCLICSKDKGLKYWQWRGVTKEE